MADQPNVVPAPDSGEVAVAAHSGPTRRQLLLGAGALLGITAVASTPLLKEAFAALARMIDPAVGVVAPDATRYPGLLDQLAAGVRDGLAAGGKPDAPVFARTAPGSAPSSVASVARELVEREKVDLVIAYANPTQAQLLGELAEETGVPVVVVDPGAHIVTSADAEPRVLSHSLGYWQSVWELGSWSAKGAGSKAYVISSRYECGFDILNAFGHGLRAAGGSVVGTSVTHLRPGDVAKAVSAAAASRADSLFVACSGAEADELLAAVAADKGASAMHLLVAGVASDRLVSAPGLSATTALTWPVAGGSVFEMLGRDVGELVAAAVDGGAEALPAGENTLDGARGRVTFDLASGRTDVPVTIASATADAAGVTYKPIVVAGDTARASALADEIVPDLRTGWLDVYGSSM